LKRKGLTKVGMGTQLFHQCPVRCNFDGIAWGQSSSEKNVSFSFRNIFS